MSHSPQRKKSDYLLGQLLRDVSRSFYLTLRVLPQSIRKPISIAYLLARAADTLADTDIIETIQRLKLITLFRSVLMGDAQIKSLIVEMNLFISKQNHPSEKILLEKLTDIFGLLNTLSENDHAAVTSVVMTLSGGMLDDLNTFPTESSGEIKALKTAADLEKYTYSVAGCVGEFWSNICFHHDPRLNNWDLSVQRELGIHFGKALQLTNVLRDIAEDLRLGRCYLPSEQLTDLKIKPDQLLSPSMATQLRPIHNQWINQALDYFESASLYILNTPRKCVLLRLATLWPVMIGLHTLKLVSLNDDYLNPNKRLKISRYLVYRLISLSFFIVSSNSFSKYYLNRLISSVRSNLKHIN